jgi:hypothetical protein
VRTYADAEQCLFRAAELGQIRPSMGARDDAAAQQATRPLGARRRCDVQVGREVLDRALRSARAGFWTAVGVLRGLAVHTTAAVLGLSLLSAIVMAVGAVW